MILWMFYVKEIEKIEREFQVKIIGEDDLILVTGNENKQETFEAK